MATKEARHDANYQTIRNFIKNETQGFSITNGEYSLEYLTKFFVIKGDQAIHHLYIERKLLDDNNSQELLVFLKMFDLAGTPIPFSHVQ